MLSSFTAFFFRTLTHTVDSMQLPDALIIDGFTNSGAPADDCLATKTFDTLDMHGVPMRLNLSYQWPPISLTSKNVHVMPETDWTHSQH